MPYGNIQRGLGVPDPFQRAKQYATWGELGRGAQMATGARAQLAGQGLMGVPGVAEAAQNRIGAGVSQRIGQLGAQYDVQGLQFGEQQRQFNAQLDFAKQQYRDAKNAAEKAFWQDLIGSLIGAAGAIGGAAIGGPAGAAAGSRFGQFV